MGSPRMIGQFKTYIPNHRADIRRKKLYQRNREYTDKHKYVLDEIRERRMIKEMMDEKMKHLDDRLRGDCGR